MISPLLSLSLQPALVAARLCRLGSRSYVHHSRHQPVSFAAASPAPSATHTALQQGQQSQYQQQQEYQQRQQPATDKRIHARVCLLLGADTVDGNSHRETGAATASASPAAGAGHTATAPSVPERVSAAINQFGQYAFYIHRSLASQPAAMPAGIH